MAAAVITTVVCRGDSRRRGPVSHRPMPLLLFLGLHRLRQGSQFDRIQDSVPSKDLLDRRWKSVLLGVGPMSS